MIAILEPVFAAIRASRGAQVYPAERVRSKAAELRLGPIFGRTRAVQPSYAFRMHPGSIWSSTEASAPALRMTCSDRLAWRMTVGKLGTRSGVAGSMAGEARRVSANH